MWSTRVTDLPGGSRIELWTGARPVPYGDVIDRWKRDDKFVTWFNSLLASASFQAYRWETPAVSAATLAQAFEFVLVDAPELMRPSSSASFVEQFKAHPEADVVAFANLGRDAVMVVPRPLGADAVYGHLAAFVRGAPEAQRLELWRAVGNAMEKRINDRAVWLSTAGAGVPWLHVRLDDRPKYYHFNPYRQTAPNTSLERAREQ